MSDGIPRTLYVALGYEVQPRGDEHVICCGVFGKREQASQALAGFEKQNVVAVFEGAKHRVPVFETIPAKEPGADGLRQKIEALRDEHRPFEGRDQTDEFIEAVLKLVEGGGG